MYLVPTTPETRKQLQQLDASTIPATESEAQAVLALLHREADPDWTPNCYRKKFDPVSPVCGSCVLSARCWTADRGYLDKLREGSVEAPPGMPDAIVKRALKRGKGGSRAVAPRVK